MLELKPFFPHHRITANCSEWPVSLRFRQQTSTVPRHTSWRRYHTVVEMQHIIYLTPLRQAVKKCLVCLSTIQWPPVYHLLSAKWNSKKKNFLPPNWEVNYNTDLINAVPYHLYCLHFTKRKRKLNLNLKIKNTVNSQ